MTYRMLRLPEVMKKVGISKSLIYKMIQEGEFPRSVKLGPRTSCWNEADIDAWIDKKIKSAKKKR